MSSWFESLKKSTFPERTPIYAAAETQNVSKKFAGRATCETTVLSEKRSSLDIQEVAPPQSPKLSQLSPSGSELCVPSDLTSTRHPNVFDKITRAAGSSATFFVMLSLVFLWMVIGFVYGTTDTWHIIFQNASSIQVYVTDILLIRQQQNASRALLTNIAELRSRNKTCERLLDQIPGCSFEESHKEPPKKLLFNGQPFDDISAESMYLVSRKPSRFRYVWNRTCHVVAMSLGSIWSFIIYWIGIGIWTAAGPYLNFSNSWQLYINTATALTLTFTSVFLQNIQRQEEENMEKCLEYALKVDAEVEYHLRELTDDVVPNPIFEMPALERTWTERRIDEFADIMGSGLGIVISVAFTIAWIGVGPLLKFEDNWWLIIGTFTGLVGFIDGFVLRSLYYREERNTKVQFENVATADIQILDRLNIMSTPKALRVRSLVSSISVAIGNACGHPYSSVGAVSAVAILIAIASVMKWSETGQLLCNTPTMIVEGFLLLVLIQAHNNSNEERGADFNGVLRRRLLLNTYVQVLSDDKH